MCLNDYGNKKKLVLDLNDPVCVKSGRKYVSAYNEFKYFR